MLATLAAMPLSAQRTLVEMAIRPEAILIGEQATVTVTVTSDVDRPVTVLLPQDTLMLGVEILEASGWDTASVENGRRVMRQELLVTSYDSSLYLLPPVAVVDRNDTVYSESVALKVSTVPVDIDHPEKFADIKDIWKPPFVWKDYLVYLWWILAAAALAAAVWYGLKFWRRRKSPLPEDEGPKTPAHERALKALEDIRLQKLWQQGKNKEYHTLVTDTLRRYMSERFEMDAMEMTSGEILDRLRREPDAEAVFRNLEQVLHLADFVKFAKMTPLPDENDRSMADACLFVERTKKVEIIETVE
jgi:hypothetical protein